MSPINDLDMCEKFGLSIPRASHLIQKQMFLCFIFSRKYVSLICIFFLKKKRKQSFFKFPTRAQA